MSSVWWSGVSLAGFLGFAPHDGLEWRRHHYNCRPGLWAVCITGWTEPVPAVVDDFGNLVRVE